MNRNNRASPASAFLLTVCYRYAELDKLPMGAYTVLSLLLLTVFAVYAYRAAQA